VEPGKVRGEVIDLEGQIRDQFVIDETEAHRGCGGFEEGGGRWACRWLSL
jgi:hypothetical protein